MSNKLLHIINWIFGGTTFGTVGMWLMELGNMIVFEYWIKIGVGVLAIIVGLLKVYDWIEKKCRRYKKLNGTRPK